MSETQSGNPPKRIAHVAPGAKGYNLLSAAKHWLRISFTDQFHNRVCDTSDYRLVYPDKTEEKAKMAPGLVSRPVPTPGVYTLAFGTLITASWGSPSHSASNDTAYRTSVILTVTHKEIPQNTPVTFKIFHEFADVGCEPILTLSSKITGMEARAKLIMSDLPWFKGTPFTNGDTFRLVFKAYVGAKFLRSSDTFSLQCTVPYGA